MSTLLTCLTYSLDELEQHLALLQSGNWLSFYHLLNLENSWSILAPKSSLGLYCMASEARI